MLMRWVKKAAATTGRKKKRTGQDVSPDGRQPGRQPDKRATRRTERAMWHRPAGWAACCNRSDADLADGEYAPKADSWTLDLQDKTDKPGAHQPPFALGDQARAIVAHRAQAALP